MSARLDLTDLRDWVLPSEVRRRHPDPATVRAWVAKYMRRGWWSPELSYALDRVIVDEEGEADRFWERWR